MNFDTVASPETVAKTAEALRGKGYNVIVVNTKQEALEQVKKLIPDQATVMKGASVSLEEIGFVEYLESGKHPWHNLHAEITAENNKAKRDEMRRMSLTSDFYLGSIHGLAENGEFIVASNTASQLPHVVYSSPNVIFVVGTQKIVPTLTDAMQRLEEYIIPLEEQHMQQLYGVGTHISKVVLFKDESPMTGRKINIVLVNEKIGY